MNELTITALMDIVRSCAGEAEIPAAGEVGDTAFGDLGYDSLALLETVSQIERTYGVHLADDEVTGTTTPQALLDAVNGAVRQKS
ncbi:acyl carrier protein [Streptomyces sp. NPDC020801]|uniref:acyl carrier protein n=1 Tax=unclassified Streptomyces TaxID=2593676 RepID=UPI00378F79C8